MNRIIATRTVARLLTPQLPAPALCPRALPAPWPPALPIPGLPAALLGALAAACLLSGCGALANAPSVTPAAASAPYSATASAPRRGAARSPAASATPRTPASAAPVASTTSVPPASAAPVASATSVPPASAAASAGSALATTKQAAQPGPVAAGQAARTADEAARATGRPELTLDQVVNTVLVHNPNLLAVQQAQVTARAGVLAARALPNPTIEWQPGRSRARLPSATSGPLQGVAISVPLENPAVRGARVGAAKAGEQGTVHLVAASRNTMVAQVRLRAYEMVLREAQAEAALDALRLLEQMHERVRVRVASGEAPRYEIIRADSEIVNARQQEQTARLRAEQAQLALNRLAAGQLPIPFRLDVTLQDSLPLQEMGTINPMTHPDLRQLQAEVDRAQARLDGAKAGRWPGVALNYGQIREPEVRQSVFGLSVQVPLLNQSRGLIDEAASELERARLQFEGRQVELQQETLEAWKDLEVAQARTQALSQGSVRGAEAALRVAEAAYRFGERGILDVLDAQRVLRAVRADLLDARYQLQAARIQLEALAGRYSAQAAL